MRAETCVPSQGCSSSSHAGLTVHDVARRYRVGEDKVRNWITRGELRAVNTATTLCGRPRWVIPPEALAEFEARRSGAQVSEPRPRRRRVQAIDFYP
jgi:transposase